MPYEAWFDGSCEPYNPGGNMGYGGIVKDAAGNRLATLHGGCGPARCNTNNVAEYRALRLVLNWFLEQGLEHEEIVIYGDSRLVVKQVGGRWRIKGGHYADTAREVKVLWGKFSKAAIKWVPRDFNQEADGVSKL